jgi:hypothetical protein
MTTSGLLKSLQVVSRALPTTRKRLVTPDINLGRELLAALARTTGGWIGWEASNLRGIAEDLAFVPLSLQGRRAGSDIEVAALVNRALDKAIAGHRVSGRFETLQKSLGFRRALRDALLALRMGGVSVNTIQAAVIPGSPTHDLPAILEEYEALLERRNLTDPAGLFHAALESFDTEAPYVLDGEIVLTPSLNTRGLPGMLLQRLLAHGARPLVADSVIGSEAPASTLSHLVSAAGIESVGEAEMSSRRSSSLAWLTAAELPDANDPLLDRSAITTDFFAASSPSEELREVCRRIAAERLRWDQVEIIATDVDTYGVALDALCQQLDVGATMLHGVPLARTRLGRALDRWFAWLDDGLPADVLRESLEAGELHVPTLDVAPTALARELRKLRVGWGRSRYVAAATSMDIQGELDALTPYDNEVDEEFASRRKSRRRGMEAIVKFLELLMAATPAVPERGSATSTSSTCALLAQATLKWFELVPLHEAAEQQTAQRLRSRLTQLAEIDDESTTFSSALATLRDALGDLRAWPLVTDGRKPWSASGGMVHLTDIAHAGATGRARTFVVGLDAHRTQGAGRQDPLLPDAACRAIDQDALATTGDRRVEAVFALAHAMASLRGRVTLSYATAGSVDGRDASPSPVFLQAWRIVRRDTRISYQDLRELLRPPACSVPRRATDGALQDIALLDERDVWFDAIADGALLLDADSLVGGAFKALDNGFRSMALAASAVLTAQQGLAPAAGRLLDPRAHVDGDISASALEKLAACPLAWFYNYGLKLRMPEEPTYDADQWLDNLERGSLLHELFETFCREYEGRQGELADERASIRMRELADEIITQWRRSVPPPSEMIFEREAEELRGAGLAFLLMEQALSARGDAGVWLEFEYQFGSGAPPGLYTLPDGMTLRMKGKIDRVDQLSDGTLRVVDYKTGSSKSYEKKTTTGAFNGGRRLQPAVYSAVISSLLAGTVSQFEYRFPTERGDSEIVDYASAEFAPVPQIINDLLDMVRSGEFVPTNDAKDCGICDLKEICRVRRGKYYKMDSPRAAWAKEHTANIDAYRAMRARRGQEEIA